MPNKTQRPNEVWVTRRKDNGTYCIRFGDGRTSEYLTLAPGNQAGWVDFPGAVRALTTLTTDFYAHGVDVKFDRSKGHMAPSAEADAMRAVVFRLGRVAGQYDRERQFTEHIGKLLSDRNSRE